MLLIACLLKQINTQFNLSLKLLKQRPPLKLLKDYIGHKPKPCTLRRDVQKSVACSDVTVAKLRLADRCFGGGSISMLAVTELQMLGIIISHLSLNLSFGRLTELFACLTACGSTCTSLFCCSVKSVQVCEVRLIFLSLLFDDFL